MNDLPVPDSLPSPHPKKTGNPTLRMMGGLALIFIGILGILLPILPGWIFILPGLGMLPYPWAQRLRRWLRAKIPGIPQEGPLPASFWISMVLFAAIGITISLLWGHQIREAVFGKKAAATSPAQTSPQ